MIQRQIQESEMTDYQKQAVEKAKKNLLFDHTEICDLRFLSLGGNVGDNFIMTIETQLAGCESKFAEVVSRHCWTFVVSKKGKYYRWTEGHYRRYFKENELYKNCMIY